MADPFIAELRLFGFNFAPVGWMQCNGQILPISQYTALFSLLGTNYGGNGTTNFAVPNLQGIVPIGQGQGPGLSPIKNPRSKLRGIGGRKEADQKNAASCGEYVPREIQRG